MKVVLREVVRKSVTRLKLHGTLLSFGIQGRSRTRFQSFGGSYAPQRLGYVTVIRYRQTEFWVSILRAIELT